MDIRAKSVGAVVVTYNRQKLLEKCLDSLLAQSRPVDHIYIVDNASTDETAQFLAGMTDRRISFRRLPTNTGGAGGFSFGMKWAYEEGHEWLWLMDDDVTADQNCLATMLSYGHVSPVLVPMRVAHDLRVVEWAATMFNLTNPLIRNFRSRVVSELYPTLSTAPDLIDIVDFTFEGPLFHRTIPEAIGFPKADFFIWGDDLEYSLRLWRKRSSRTVCVRDALLVRSPSCMSSHGLDWRSYYGWRNNLLIQCLYSGNFIMACRPFLFFIASTAKRCLRRQLSVEELRMRMVALTDALTKQLPQRYGPQQSQNASSSSQR